jgi:surface polysaccharide O-acyltransferase-like enzyme
MTNDQLLSKTISYLRFPLTVGVVFIHFSLHKGFEVHGVTHALGNPDWFFFVVNMISQVLARVCVPLFFIISGYLFFYNNEFDQQVYRKKLKSRARTLLIPYILWNIIAILWQLKFLIPFVAQFYRPVEIDLSFQRIINTFFCTTDNQGIFVGPIPTEFDTETYPIDGPLWYIRDLMLLVIISPLIHWLVKKIKILLPVILGTAWLASPVLFPHGGYLGMLVTASFFFSWGAYLSIQKINIVQALRRFKYLPLLYLAIALVDAYLRLKTPNLYVHRVGVIIGVISTVVVASYLIQSGKATVNQTLANSSFIIFASHGIYIGDVGKLLFTMLHIPENNPFCMLALYLFVPAFCIALGIAIFLLLKKFAPTILRLLNGGR